MQFQWPSALLALLLIPVLVALYVLVQRRRRAYALRFTNLALLREVVGPRPGGARRHLPPLLFLLGMAVLCIGVARPVATIAAAHRQAVVMLVIDVSGSMDTNDMQPTRLDAAKVAARAFVEGLPADALVGLVSFSDTAHLDAPLSGDHLATLSALTTLKTIGGTAIGDGLSLALEAVERQPGGRGAVRQAGTIVLLSDGSNNEGVSPSEPTARAQQHAVKVYTVGVGRPDIGLDEAALRQIATQTGGSYFNAAAGEDLKRIYSGLATRLYHQAQQTELTALATALGGILAVAGALLGLFWLHRFP
jgi:Ca-activated chloride channel family protein